MRKSFWVLLIVFLILIIGSTIGVALVKPEALPRATLWVQLISAIGGIFTALFMFLSILEIRKQTEQHQKQWEKEREAMAKPLPRCDKAWFSSDGTLGIKIINHGRTLIDSERLLIVGKLEEAIRYKEKGSAAISGVFSESPLSSYKKDLEAGKDVEVIFPDIATQTVKKEGAEFAVVMEYWDLEGRAYLVGWRFMTQPEGDGRYRISREEFSPPKRIPHRDRIWE